MVDKYDLERYCRSVSMGTITYCALFDDESLTSESRFYSRPVSKSSSSLIQYPAVATHDEHLAKHFLDNHTNLAANFSEKKYTRDFTMRHYI